MNLRLGNYANIERYSKMISFINETSRDHQMPRDECIIEIAIGPYVLLFAL